MRCDLPALVSVFRGGITFSRELVYALPSARSLRLLFRPHSPLFQHFPNYFITIHCALEHSAIKWRIVYIRRITLCVAV